LKRWIALIALLAASSALAQNTAYDNLVQSRFVHCAFYKAYDIDSATGDRIMVEGRSDTLTHFQRIDDRHARQITTRIAGSRNVAVLKTSRYLHFVDHQGGFYLLTTVYACLDRDARTGTCITYGAMQSRHFDSRVLFDPDAVYERIRDVSEPGFCDHSFIGLREAARKP
jgi:hypothetical protein